MTAAPAGPAGGSLRRGVVARPSPTTLAVAAAVAAAVVSGTSTGSAVVAALLLGACTLDRRVAAAAVLAVVATSLRFRSASLDDLAGIQEVLGFAGTVGPAAGAAASWMAAAAVLLAVGPLPGATGRWRYVPVLPAGVLAAALVAGPGPSDAGLRILSSAVAVGVAGAVARLAARRERVAGVRPWLAVAAGAAAVVLAAWPS